MEMKKAVMAIALALLVCLSSAYAQEPAKTGTKINDAEAKAKLLGAHNLSLQWVSWDYFGKANVTDNNGTLQLKGEQRSKTTSDFVTIDGMITLVDKTEFKFNGTIVTQVTFLNKGNPCKREGEFTFRITGNRKYWRLKEMDNPCDAATDYVDIYFRK